MLTHAAATALEAGDTALAARCWRQTLEAGDTAWAQVADVASRALSPDQILADVIPRNRGRYALMFADRLYATADHHASREKFLRVGAAQVKGDFDLSPAERLWLEGRAWAELDDREAALSKIQAALLLDGSRFEWRKDLVDRLIAWGNPDDAHQQALVALQFAPTNPDARKLVDQTAEAVARGVAPARPDSGQNDRR